MNRHTGRQRQKREVLEYLHLASGAYLPPEVIIVLNIRTARCESHLEVDLLDRQQSLVHNESSFSVHNRVEVFDR
jgi:hypothetical protein